MDYEKIDHAIMDTLAPLIASDTIISASDLNTAISEAIITALKEYNEQKQD